MWSVNLALIHASHIFPRLTYHHHTPLTFRPSPVPSLTPSLFTHRICTHAATMTPVPPYATPYCSGVYWLHQLRYHSPDCTLTTHSDYRRRHHCMRTLYTGQHRCRQCGTTGNRVMMGADLKALPSLHHKSVSLRAVCPICHPS